MKLSNYSSLTITSAATVIYGLGIFQVPSVLAQSPELDKITTEVVSLMETADSDQALVDSLTQVEAELTDKGIKSFVVSNTDTPEIRDLKQRRIELIKNLRTRLAGLEGEQKAEYLRKIRDRRKEMQSTFRSLKVEQRTHLKEVRENFRKNLLDKQLPEGTAVKKYEEKKLEQQQKLDAAREAYKQKIMETQRKQQLEPKTPEQLEEKRQQRSKVQGAVDYQPQGFWERLGYMLSGIR